MYKQFVEWLNKNKNIFYVALLVFVLTMYYMPYFMNRPVEGNFEGSIQNRLVWAVKGECYFVRPLNQTDTLLVRVTDCDRK